VSEQLEDGFMKYTSSRLLDTQDPYDYIIQKNKEITMAFSIIHDE
jgi:hypothetical protein